MTLDEDDIELTLAIPPTIDSNDDVAPLIPETTSHAVPSNDIHSFPKSGDAQVTVNIIISFVGAGLLGIPSAFRRAGWLLGSLGVCGTSLFNVYALLRLPVVKSKLRERNIIIHSYGDMGRELLPRGGETALNIALAVSQMGFATAYLIFIAANARSIVGIARGTTIAWCLPGLALLVQARDMTQLSPFSLLANLSNLLGLGSVLLVDLEREVDHEAPDRVKVVDLSGLLYVMAVTLYSMEGVALVLSLEESCQNAARFPFLLQRTVGAITVFMALFGSAGYAAFGDETMAPITLNLGDSTAATTVQVALCVALYLTYPIMMFPVWNILESSNLSTQRRVLQRLGIVGFTAMVAWACPDFGEFLSLMGSSLCTILGFCLPCYFHHRVLGDHRLKWQIGTDWLLIVGGLLFSVVGTYQSAQNLLQHSD